MIVLRYCKLLSTMMYLCAIVCTCVFGPLDFGLPSCCFTVAISPSCYWLPCTSRSRFFSGTWHEEDPFVLLPSVTIQLKNPSTGADHGTLTVPWEGLLGGDFGSLKIIPWIFGELSHELDGVFFASTK